MKARDDYYVGIKDVERITGFAQAKGYRVIKELNAELAQKGFLTVRGYTPKKYFLRRFGLEDWEADTGNGNEDAP